MPRPGENSLSESPRTLTRRESRLFAELQGRHGRKKSEFCVCEGVRCCGELFLSPALVLVEVVAVTRETLDKIAVPAQLAAKIVITDEAILRDLSGTVNNQGMLALVRRPAPVTAETPSRDPFLLALDRLGDPGNFGTILRTARAAGLREVWYTAGSVDPFNAKVIRAGLAAQFSMILREFPDLLELCCAAKKLGFPTVWLTDPHKGESCFACSSLFDHTVIVIGSEAHGVGEAAGNRVTIPMPGGFESLNAAQAAAIVLFEHVRRMTGAGGGGQG